MDVSLEWFNGFYGLSFANVKKANKFFTAEFKKRNNLMHINPLVNSKWCMDNFEIENPLEMNFEDNRKVWNDLHPTFDANWYYKTYRLHEIGEVNPYKHFLSIGHLDQLQIHPLIDFHLLSKQFPGIAYLDLVVLVGDIIMEDKIKELKITNFYGLPILNSKIDSVYLYPALHFGWL